MQGRLATGVVAIAPTKAFDYLWGFYVGFEATGSLLVAGANNTGLSWISPYLLWTIAGGSVIEEVFFRGVVLGSLQCNTNVSNALIFQAMLFAAWHGSVQNFVPLIFAGVIYGIALTKTGSLLIPMGAHVCGNGIVVWQKYLIAPS
ncbi:MAG: CPBP family intramembrane glutamic endopeptidase [Burkholderiales bacterium]